MQSILSFFTGTSIGYLAGIIFGGTQEGQPGIIKSVILNLGAWRLHLHHWLTSIIALILILVLPFLRKKYKFHPILFFIIIGFLGGLIFQGIISYGDWHQILIR